MGATISDIHQRMYNKWRSDGLSHEEAISLFPSHLKEEIKKDLGMTAIESHFGIKDKYFFALLISLTLIAVILII